MRRPTSKLVLSIAFPAILASLMLAGCGGGDSPEGSIEQPEISGMLRKVRTASELENSLKSSLPAALALAPPPAPGNADVAIGGVSATYTAEAGVDEYDHVRYDGNYLYVGT